jgi:hypothetical protein
MLFLAVWIIRQLLFGGRKLEENRPPSHHLPDKQYIKFEEKCQTNNQKLEHLT